MAALVFALACGTETITEERTVVVTVVVPEDRTVIVEKIVEVTVTPVPETTASTGPSVYRMGIFQEPNTRNYWNYFGGPGGSVWTGYVLDGVATTPVRLFGPALRLGSGSCGRISHGTDTRDNEWQEISDQ